MSLLVAYSRSVNRDSFPYRAKVAAVKAFITSDSQHDIS